MIAPALARVPVLFRWNVNDGLNGQQLIARSFSTELAGVLTRTSTKTVADRNGRLYRLPRDLPPLSLVDGQPGLLLEPARENLCIRSEEFDTWTSVNVTVTANAVTAPDGTLTADTLTATTGSTDYLLRAPTFTGDGEKCFAFYVRAGTAASSIVQIRDTTAALDRHLVSVTWTAGVPTLSTSTGAGTLYPVEALASGWYRILFSATSIVAANNTEIRIRPANAAGLTSTWWGAQAENAVVPSSYIPTAASTATRNADSLYFPFTAPPQAMTVYARLRNLGAYINQPTGARVLHIGDVMAGTDPRFSLSRGNGTAQTQALYDDGVTLAQSFVTPSPAVARGDLIEHRGVLRSTWNVVNGVTVNGGTEVVGSAAASGASVAWANARLYLAGIADSDITAVTHVCVAAGERSLADMRELAGV